MKTSLGFLFVYAFILCLIFCGLNPAFANNIAVANVSLTSQDTTNNYEKACRGGQTPAADEYAWGNTSITAATTISGTENGTETITNANANCCYNNQTFTGGDAGQGPLRCGIFATGSSTRAASGGGYYGVMELSGNLWERPVTVGNTQGRGFTGAHGAVN